MSELNRMILGAIRTTRHETLTDIIRICERLAQDGRDAARCAQYLRELQDTLVRFESKTDVNHRAN